MENGVIKFEEECWVELYPINKEDDDYLFQITKEQYELTNKILRETEAKFIQIDKQTFSVGSIRRVYKKTRKVEIPPYTTVIENKLTPEQKEKNLKALAELKEQLKYKRILQN